MRQEQLARGLLDCCASTSGSRARSQGIADIQAIGNDQTNWVGIIIFARPPDNKPAFVR